MDVVEDAKRRQDRAVAVMMANMRAEVAREVSNDLMEVLLKHLRRMEKHPNRCNLVVTLPGIDQKVSHEAAVQALGLMIAERVMERVNEERAQMIARQFQSVLQSVQMANREGGE